MGGKKSKNGDKRGEGGGWFRFDGYGYTMTQDARNTAGLQRVALDRRGT